MNVLQALPIISELVDRFEPATERFSMVEGGQVLNLENSFIVLHDSRPDPPITSPDEILDVVRWTLAFAIPTEAATVNTIEVGPGGKWLRSPATTGLFTKGGTK